MASGYICICIFQNYIQPTLINSSIVELLHFLKQCSSTFTSLAFYFYIFYMYKQFVDVCHTASLYTSLFKYLKHLDNGPRWPKHVGDQL